MGNKILNHYKLEDKILSIAGKDATSAIENFRPYEVFEAEDKLIVLYDIIDLKGKHTNANVIAYDKKGNQLWRVEPVFSEDVSTTGAYIAFGYDDKSQSYRLVTFHGETVQLDIATGKITRLGIYSR